MNVTDSGATIDPIYAIEQSIFRSINCLLGLLFVIQIVNHYFAYKYNVHVPNAKKVFHWTCLLCCILNAIKSIDEQNVYQTFGAQWILMLTNNVTPLLMLCGAVVVFSMIDVQYKFSRKRSPRWLKILLNVWSFANIVVFNVMTVVSIVENVQVYYLSLVVYMGVAFLMLLVLANTGLCIVARLVSKVVTRRAFNAKLQTSHKQLKKLYIFTTLCNLVLSLVTAQIARVAFNYYAQQSIWQTIPPSCNPQVWSPDLFAYAHTVFLIVYCFWSWIELVLLIDIPWIQDLPCIKPTRQFLHPSTLSTRGQSLHAPPSLKQQQQQKPIVIIVAPKPVEPLRLFMDLDQGRKNIPANNLNNLNNNHDVRRGRYATFPLPIRPFVV